jgi:hypothetical protein
VAIACKIGFHSWNGCKCSNCGKMRDVEHKWDGCKCTICGKIRDDKHDWSKDCEKCAKCGKTRQNSHKWDGCKCTICGKTRDEGHAWNGCKCSQCGLVRNENHDWTKNCAQCSICGVTREDTHKWNGCKCELCGALRDDLHSWIDSRCSICGAISRQFIEGILNNIWKTDNDVARLELIDTLRALGPQTCRHMTEIAYESQGDPNIENIDVQVIRRAILCGFALFPAEFARAYSACRTGISPYLDQLRKTHSNDGLAGDTMIHELIEFPPWQHMYETLDELTLDEILQKKAQIDHKLPLLSGAPSDTWPAIKRCIRHNAKIRDKYVDNIELHKNFLLNAMVINASAVKISEGVRSQPTCMVYVWRSKDGGAVFTTLSPLNEFLPWGERTMPSGVKKV